MNKLQDPVWEKRRDAYQSGEEGRGESRAVVEEQKSKDVLNSIQTCNIESQALITGLIYLLFQRAKDNGGRRQGRQLK